MEAKLGDLYGVGMTGIILTRIQVKDESLADKVDTETGKVLVPKAIVNGKVNHKDVAEYVIKKGSGQSRMTVVDDVVVKLTTPYECALITMEDEDLIVPSYCLILRDFDPKEIDLHYLVGYLNTESAKEQLVTRVSAGYNSMIKMKDVQEIPVPILPMEEQKYLGRLYRISTEKQMLLRDMLENEIKMADSLITSAVLKGVEK